MKKNLAELFAENIFNSPLFQKKWQGYIAAFGSDIAELFPDSYKEKVAIASILQKITNENYQSARRELMAYVDLAHSKEEKATISRLIALCTENIPEPDYPKKSAQYMQYRQLLFENGFSEAEKHHGHFFRQATEKTAFVINLYDSDLNQADSRFAVVYGFASTALTAMTGCENHFAEYGADKESCHVRNIIRIDDNELYAVKVIADFYNIYKDYQKDRILEVKKERRKNFLAHFAGPLKKLGFKKKGTKWTKILNEDNALSFEAQKSAFSDQYYFNVSIHSPSDFYARSSYERVVFGGTDIYNWQLMSEKEIGELIVFSIKNYIEPKLL